MSSMQPLEVIETRNSATWVQPSKVLTEGAGPSVAGEPAGHPPMADVLDEFVALVKHNAKVRAVRASQEGSVVQVWTYVDSTDRKDRSPVYEAEWQILERYPDVTFDFNVLLLPAGREALETESAD